MEPLRTCVAHRPARPVARAFTLIEMLVVLAIISVVTMITLYGHSNFDRSLLITDTAYTVAISVREMQTYGLSSRVASAGVRNARYGIHADITKPTSYVLFADIVPSVPGPSDNVLANCVNGDASTPEFKPGDCRYTAGVDKEVETLKLTRGLKISSICGKEMGTNTRRCSTASDGLRVLDVVYARPNTTAVLTGQRADTNGWIQLSSGEIYLSTADGTGLRAICLSGIGQISVATSTCP